MKHSPLLIVVVAVALTSVLTETSWAEIKIAHKDIPTATGLKCKATLKIKKNSRPKALAFYLWGTGIYSPAHPDFMDPALKPTLEDGRLAVLTFDKPGVIYSVDEKLPIPERFSDKEAFYAHTQADLVDCAENALKWAEVTTKPKKIFLHGHSDARNVEKSTPSSHSFVSWAARSLHRCKAGHGFGQRKHRTPQTETASS